jgi:ubiquinone biosynthesis protein
MALRISELARTGRSMKRLAPMLVVLARHGFGHLVQHLGMRHLLPVRLRGRVRVGDESALGAVSMAVRLREVLEEWGPTAIKFGQMLSTRPDLLPESYLCELRRLTNDVPPFPGVDARAIVERELEKSIEEVFSTFDSIPIAAGSIGQVHKATLLDGSDVVVKVKRPGIDELIRTDLDLLAVIAVPLLEMIDELRPLQPRVAIEEFRRGILRELDFVTEASSTEKVGKDMAECDDLIIPKVYWEYTTTSVLTLERLSGTSLSDPEALDALSLNRRDLAHTLVRVFFNQFFSTGLFHADPHAGNILVTDSGKIALLDFGLVGRLDGELRSALAGSVIALHRGDIDMVADIYVEIGAMADDTDIDAFKADVHDLIDRYYGVPLACLDLSRCVGDAMEAARRHDVILPRNLVLFAKAFNMMIMMALEIYPEFDMAAAAKPFAKKLFLQRFSPKRMGQDALSNMWHMTTAFQRLPRQLKTFARKLVKGQLQFHLQHHVEAFDGFARELDRATNRIAFSIIVSAVVIGSSVVLHARIRPHLDDILPGNLGKFIAETMPNTSVLGLGGFLFAGVMGLLLAVAIWRHGRL